mgnify:CR=1 FL=1
MQYSIVNYSQIDKALFRLEAEFYKPIYLDLEKKFYKNPNLIEFSNRIICGPFGSTILDETYTLNGIKVIRPFNIKNYQIEKDNIVYISDEDVKSKQLKIFSKGTIFFSRVGDIKCGIFPEDEGVTISPNIIAVDIKREKYNPFFLTLFFNSKYGFLQISRELKISAQPTVSTERLQNLRLPIIEIFFQNYIGSLFEKAKNWNLSAENKYNQAQNILLSELGLTNWQPKHQLTFVKNFSDTEQAERIDAEYYQPKYEEIVKAIKSYSGGWDTLGNLVIVKKCVEVGSGEYINEGIPFVRVSNLSSFEITEEKYISEKLYQEIKQHQPKKGEILFSKDATPGIAYYLNETPQKMIPSGGILRLKNKSDKINNEYLTLVLNSILTKEQVNRDVGGSVILHWRPDQVKRTAIPILPEEKQTQIQQKVTESFNLRKQSKHLLEYAKRAVEMAIEQDEETAMQWMKKETKEMQI